MKISKQIKFFVKASIIFTILSFSFSLTGLFFQDEPQSIIIGSPLVVSNPSLEHILGHIFFGMIAGMFALRLNYVFIAGAFAILLDADHLLQFLNLEMILRMSHSLPFAVITALIIFAIFGKKDYRLAAIAFSAVISHIAFDIWLSGQIFPGSTSAFPLFAPFSVESVLFQGLDWLYLEILAVGIVGIISMLHYKSSIKNLCRNLL
jgi:hypothetical protein